MKKVYFIILILAIVGIWWYATHKPTDTIINLHPITTSHPDPSNATFTIDDRAVALHGGHADNADLTNIIGYGDLNGDGKEDAAFLIAVQNPVSGMLSLYLGTYISGPVDFKATNTIPIGTQITPKSVSIKNGVITVTYLDRKPDDPLTAEPTVLTTQTYRYNSVSQDIE